jgi:TolA-binding protein
MRKIILSLVTVVLASQFSLASAADPNIRQAPTRPMAPLQGGSIPQLQLTPDYLYQQITTLQKQVTTLQAQVNALRSVVQVTQNGATIQAENLSLNAGKTLTMFSGKDTNFTAGENLNLISGKDLLAKGGGGTTVEGAGRVNLKSPEIKLNDGTNPVALVGSNVAGGKVMTGSTSVFAP